MGPAPLVTMIDLRRNNLDHIRLFLASMVFFYHAAILSGADELSWIGKVISADLAVKGFFVISGFLVFMSYERSPGLGEYLSRRMRRLYPGYASVVIIAAVSLFWASDLSASQYFSRGFWRYLAANLCFLNFFGSSLPGVFASNHFQAVNGSLWTLKIEVMFYLFVPILAWFVRRWRPLPVLLILYLFSLVYWHGLNHLASGPESFMARLARQLPGQFGYFAAGVGAYVYRRELGPFLGARTLLPAIAVIVLERSAGILFFEQAALALLIVNLGFYRSLGVNVCRFGDLSYGVYIVHFPLIQLLTQKGVFVGHPFFGLALASILVYGSAFILWHLVEKRFLRRSSHYLAATDAGFAGPAVAMVTEERS